MSNLDSIINKTKNLAGVASKKTSELFELSKFKINKMNKSAELQKNYELLGKLIYKEYKSNVLSDESICDNASSEDIKSAIEQISKIKSDIKDLDDNLVTMKNVKVCPNCGNKNNKKSLYCSLCGNQLLKSFENESYQKFNIKKDYITNDICESAVEINVNDATNIFNQEQPASTETNLNLSDENSN